MTRQIIFLDLETNGLDHRVHDAWEVAWWNLTTGHRGLFLPWLADGHGEFLRAAGNLTGLRKCKFIDRWTDEYRERVGYGKKETAAALFELSDQLWPQPPPMTPWPGDQPPGSVDWNTHRSVVITAQPKFDLPFLSKLLDAYGVESEPWFYRSYDIGSYAVGKLDMPEDDPPGAATVAQWCGVAPGDHSAWNDVTSGGRCYLLLREFGRLRRVGKVSSWESFRELYVPAQEKAIDELIQGVVIPA